LFIELTHEYIPVLINVDAITDVLQLGNEAVEISIIDRDPLTVNQPYAEVRRLIGLGHKIHTPPKGNATTTPTNQADGT
jgi:hypothetical protein